ncbi:hypothetical protein QFC21_006414 [Naganishia friedmannii]|uniref:Uncharacterized protein n=1 Tax=Naganishia friedmannii TaxID=89922 RepID=A0ACC2V206_9TREE|nr:hypothetical protein QFC21_006414 [Naganishia friedmannii]
MLRTSARNFVATASRSAAASTRPAGRQIAQRGLTTAAARAHVKLQFSSWTQTSGVLSRAGFHSTSLLCAETVKVPQMAESITEGTLKQWSKQVGDFVNQDEEIATIETDKIDVSVNAPMSGTITEFLANEDDTVSVGQDLLRIEPGEEGASGGAPAAKEEKPAASKEDPPAKDDTKPDSSVAEKSEAKSPAQEQPKKQEAPKPALAKSEKPAPKDNTKQAVEQKVAGSRNETRVKMSRMRTTIAKRLKQSQEVAASLTTFNEIDMSALMKFRTKYKDLILKEQGVKLGFMSAFAKASCLALKELPAGNASIDGDSIIYRDYVDLSVAVATEKGLVTPIVRNAESMGLIEIEQAIAGLGKKARDNKLALEDMSGGTFTISNGGVFGSLFGTPILNMPQAAILGIHAIKEKPVVVNGEIVIRPMMIVALTYDHRLLDGREAVTMLVRIKEYIEDPARMLLEPKA